MFNENPDKEDYAETATAGGGVGGGGLECRCFRSRFSAAVRRGRRCGESVNSDDVRRRRWCSTISTRIKDRISVHANVNGKDNASSSTTPQAGGGAVGLPDVLSSMR